MNDNNKSENVQLVSIECSSDGTQYHINLRQGSTVNETAFCVSAMIKCLVRDGAIKTTKEFTDLVNRYLTEEQYQEVK